MPSLDFKGKSFVYTHHLGVPHRELNVVPKLSCPPEGKRADLDDNLIIHGDNLEALKALLPRYAGKVDCIYIDPPYNTGTEGWCYNDKVNSPLMKEWLKKSANPVDREDLQRHDKWLSMMFPRLSLLKELLAEDGAIFISIDDNEVHRLRAVMDEIFGEDNFLGLFPRRTKSGGGSASDHFAIEHDYVLIYSKNKEALGKLSIDYDPEYAKRYSLEDEEGRYYWDTFERSYTATKPYIIDAPDGQKLTGNWFRAESRYKQDLKKGEIKFKKKTDGSWSVQFKQRMPNGRKLRSLLTGNEFKSAPEELEQLKLPVSFNYPKPVKLVSLLVKALGRKDAIILDSFAGSGTTAHAVLALNKEDGGNRRFILCEMEDYADALTAERVRKVIKGYEFQGIAETELYPPEKISWTTFNKDTKRNEILERIAGFKALEGSDYDKIETKITDGVLSIVGQKQITETMPPLGGSFTYVELGEAMDLESLLAETPSSLPSFESLARYLFFTATGHTLPTDEETPKAKGKTKRTKPDSSSEGEGNPVLIGETPLMRIYLNYNEYEDWLRSPASALTRKQAEEIAKKRDEEAPEQMVLIFGTSKFISQKALKEMNIQFAQLPYALHRVQSA